MADFIRKNILKSVQKQILTPKIITMHNVLFAVIAMPRTLVLRHRQKINPEDNNEANAQTYN